jgi:hypothetical protein
LPTRLASSPPAVASAALPTPRATFSGAPCKCRSWHVPPTRPSSITRSPRSPRTIGGAQVVTVHDLAFEVMPEAFDANYRRYTAFAHRTAARRAAMVIAVSDSTAAEIKGVWGVPEQRIVVARHGPGQQLKVTRRKKAPTHFLYVGDDEPRKDLPTLLAAYAEYRAAAAKPLPLVLAGQFRFDYDTAGVSVEPKVSPSVLHSSTRAPPHSFTRLNTRASG